jgi:hypothetical protein
MSQKHLRIESGAFTGLSQVRQRLQPLLRASLLLVGLGLAACGPADGLEVPQAEPGIGTDIQAIKSGTPVRAGSSAAKSTVGINTDDRRCTGVIISTTKILTAAHCRPIAWQTFVQFYYGDLPSGGARVVTGVAVKPGVNPDTDDMNDSEGNFADMAVLTLDGPIPAGFVPVPLARSFDTVTWKMAVGRGLHDGQSNDAEQMRWKYVGVQSTEDGAGDFLSNEQYVDLGDSGGPMYNITSWGPVGGDYDPTFNLAGVAGETFFRLGSLEMKVRYTSVSFFSHRTWLNSQLGYVYDPPYVDVCLKKPWLCEE